MRAAVVSAASVLALVVGASAAPFQLLSMEAGGAVDGIDGAGFATSGSFFNQSGGNTVGSHSIGPGESNGVQFDSFFMIDDVGPSAIIATTTSIFYGDYLAPGYNGVDGTDLSSMGGQAGGYGSVEGLGSHITGGVAEVGVGIASDPGFGTFTSGLAPNVGGGRSALDGAFIGRLTVTRGASLSGGGLFAIKEGLNTFTGDVAIGGGSVVIGSQSYDLVAYLVAQENGLIDDGGFGDVFFGDSDTYDVWLQIIPTPGTLALLGLGGVAAIRRRRA